jgi:hypothetical protein
VEDIAKLHLAALTFDDVQNERLLGFAHRFNFNSFLRAIRSLAPERTFLPYAPVQLEASTIVDNRRSNDILSRLEGEGRVSFEESVRRSCLDTYGDDLGEFDGRLD